MNVEHLNPFVGAASTVLETMLGSPPIKGDLSIQPCNTTHHQVNVVCGITGHLSGQVIYGMSLVTADRIASVMIGKPIKVFDHLAASAIAELGNIISGHAMYRLSESGLKCDISPPSLVRGTKVEINMLTIPAIVVPFLTPHGEVSVAIGLLNSKKEEAA